ncbi:MAG: hypothetical protein Q8K70_04120 [Bacteroidota bacterium]|nr:hypothetical protein [Bacteroidota bacterium]
MKILFVKILILLNLLLGSLHAQTAYDDSLSSSEYVDDYSSSNESYEYNIEINDSLIQKEYQQDLQPKFEKSEWEKHAKNIRFDEDTPPEIKKKKISQSRESSFNIKQFKYLFFIIALLLVIYLIYVIAKNQQSKNIKVSPQILYSAEKLNEEQIKALNYEELLAQAIQQKNYKNAYRIQYLQCLKDLILKNWIIYHKNDTNHELLNQLRSKRVYDSFKILTLNFDKIWYGEIEINQDNYNDFLSYFNQFKEDLKQQ